MSSHYAPVPREGDKYPFTVYDSSSTLGYLEDPEVESFARSQESKFALLRSTRPKANARWLWAVQAVLFFISCILLAAASNVRSSTLRHVREFSAWSPADISVKYDTIKYNITTKENRFVGAGPEVDQAWREISYDMGDQFLSRSDISRLGMPETSLKVNHPITGVEGYRVGMEVFHQLHCINLLRRVTYREYYEPLGGEFGKGPEALQRHTDHCIEVLRLNVQCNADIGLFTLYMIEGDPLPWPELNSRHVCRDFDRVREWAVDNSVGNMEVIG